MGARDLNAMRCSGWGGAGPVWPVLPGALELLQGGLVAERVETEVGVVALDSAGSIPLLLVDLRTGGEVSARGCWRSGWPGSGARVT